VIQTPYLSITQGHGSPPALQAKTQQPAGPVQTADGGRDGERTPPLVLVWKGLTRRGATRWTSGCRRRGTVGGCPISRRRVTCRKRIASWLGGVTRGRSITRGRLDRLGTVIPLAIFMAGGMASQRQAEEQNPHRSNRNFREHHTTLQPRVEINARKRPTN